MSKKFAYLCAASLLLAATGPACLHMRAARAADEGPPQFEETFETLDASWGEGETYGVKDGKFFIDLQPDYWQCVLNQTNVFKEVDARVEVTIVKLDDPDKGGAGLVFWAQDYSSYYAFMIDTGGRYHVGRYAEQRWRSAVDWKAHDAIKKGEGQTNELRVVTKDRLATLYVNGVQVASFKGQPPEGGQALGLLGDSASTEPTRFEFDNLKVL